MARTKGETIREVTDTYLSQIDVNNPPIPADIQGDILNELRDAFALENGLKNTKEQWKYMDALLPVQIADILLKLYPIVNIACSGVNTDRDYDILAIYQNQGENEGIYVASEHTFRLLANEYGYALTDYELKQVLGHIRDRAPRKTRCESPNLIAVNNGIFDYDTKKLLPFSPDLIFIAKSKVNYNKKAKNIVLHNDEDGTDWDIESWVKDLFENPEMCELIWEILGAIIRPNVSWNKSAWFYSNTGNNGKGTLCELMRQLTGEGSYASIPLSDFSKDFMLEPLTRATSIIVDENDVGTFIDKAANLKAIITNDVIQLNRKFKSPIAYQFKGFMVQCLNEMPRIKDKSDSFYRRQLFVPFTKCFTGKERKYIKRDYFHNKDVLEYVLYRVLHMDYHTLSEPEDCRLALESYKAFNDPVRQFMDDVISQCVWDLLPFGFLYDLYKCWMKENAPNGGIQGRNTFINDLITVSGNNPNWYCTSANKLVRSGNLMQGEEPLAITYGLKQWTNFSRASRYRGLLRVNPGTDLTKIPVFSDMDEPNEQAL